jgi:hypothetical protein
MASPIPSIGNSVWGRANIWHRAEPTQFDIEVDRLRLNDEDSQIHSRALRKWAKRNVNKLYVPENLLRAWGIRSWGSLAEED